MIAGTVLFVALVIVLLSWVRRPGTVALPGTIITVAAGYPFALQVKNQMDRTAHLTTVIIDFERRGDQFDVPQIVYGFASPKPNGRVFAITVDNKRQEAFPALDVPNSPDTPHMPPRDLPPLDLSRITHDIFGVVEIAKTNGLEEFCALASPKHGSVGLRLSNNSAGSPVWGVIGDGWDEAGPIAGLAITIDARTGVVLNHTIDKAVNRP